jgi:hypothetical protein
MNIAIAGAITMMLKKENIEQGISNFEVLKRFAFSFNIIVGIPYFDIQNSMFETPYLHMYLV